jgi:hypothetical protein
MPRSFWNSSRIRAPPGGSSRASASGAASAARASASGPATGGASGAAGRLSTAVAPPPAGRSPWKTAVPSMTTVPIRPQLWIGSFVYNI